MNAFDRLPLLARIALLPISVMILLSVAIVLGWSLLDRQPETVQVEPVLNLTLAQFEQAEERSPLLTEWLFNWQTRLQLVARYSPEVDADIQTQYEKLATQATQMLNDTRLSGLGDLLQIKQVNDDLDSRFLQKLVPKPGERTAKIKILHHKLMPEMLDLARQLKVDLSTHKLRPIRRQSQALLSHLQFAMSTLNGYTSDAHSSQRDAFLLELYAAENALQDLLLSLTVAPYQDRLNRLETLMPSFREAAADVFKGTDKLRALVMETIKMPDPAWFNRQQQADQQLLCRHIEEIRSEVRRFNAALAATKTASVIDTQSGTEDLLVQLLGLLAIAVVVVLIFSALLAASIRRSITAISNPLQSMVNADGVLNHRLDENTSPELKPVVQAFNRYVDLIGETRSEIGQSVQVINQVSSQLEQQSSQGGQVLKHQRQALRTASDASHALSSIFETVNSSRIELGEDASHIQQESINGEKQLEKTTVQLRELVAQVADTVVSMDKLSEDRNKISDALSVITSISGQTNLLALNAAIEAARAGEHGRGFAVVADEVRLLATQTQGSTEEIRDIMESLEDRASKTEALMAISNEMSRQSLAEIEQLAVNFEHMRGIVSQVSKLIQTVETAAAQQGQTSTEIVSHIKQLGNLLQGSQEQLNETSGQSKALEALSAQFNQQLKRFG